jgi:hypothetical protein
LSQRPDALIAGADPFLNLQLHEIIDFLESNRIPAMFSAREYVLAGGLMSYSASFSDLFGVARHTCTTAGLEAI